MQLRKRGDTWHVVFYDAEGRRRFRTTRCTDRRAADAAGRRLERQAQGGTDATENPTTLGNALENLIDDRTEKAVVGKRSMGTVDMYRTKAGHLKRVFEHDADGDYVPFRIAALAARHVDDYVSRRRAEGAAENTISKELVTLRAALKIAKRRGDWIGDVDAIMPIAFSPEYKPRTRNLAQHELAQLLGALTADHAARAAFIVATSACLGETNRAQRCDILGGEVFVRGTKRTSRKRTVPLAKDWQKRLIAYAVKHAQGRDGDLFRCKSGFDDALNRACDDLGLARCSPNDLRRTFAHWMRVIERVPLELIAPMMGHANTKMLEQVYGKLSTSELACLLNGTPVAQANALSLDRTDEMDSKKRRKYLKNGAPGGSRTRNPLRAQDFKSLPEILPSPRKYKKNRDYDENFGTRVTQQKAAAVVPLTRARKVMGTE